MAMGRPRKPDEERRTNELRIRLTDAERERLDEAAQKLGEETSTWARAELEALARKILRKK